MQKVVTKTLTLIEEHKKQQTVAELGKKPKDVEAKPSVQFRLQTSRQLVEL